MLQRIASAVLVLLTALPAAAETLGTITATMDGEERTWFITAEDGESQSMLVQPMAGSLSMSSVQLWGNPSEDKIATTKDVLMLRTTLAKGADGAISVNPTLQYMVKGFNEQWVAMTEGAVEISFTTVEMADGSLSLAGSFTAQTNYTEDMMGQKVDASKSMEITGKFDVKLPTP